MKKAILLLVLGALLGGSAMAQVDWKTIQQAAALDSTNQKMIFVDFSTSWCGWCKRMDRETFNDQVVSAILNKYFVPVKFDAEGNDDFIWNGARFTGTPAHANGHPGTHQFKTIILGEKTGYPSFAIFTPQRTIMQILEGYQSAYDFQKILWYIVNNDYVRYSFDNYSQIFDEQIKPDMMRKLGLAR